MWGTDVEFLWSFGDGSSKSGLSTEQHVFHRTGEFIMEVKVSNLVSSASLTSHIFVVDRPCQPPPVKNMGPFKIQVRRYEVIRLGVTYETEVDCDAPGGLYYSWTLYDSVGRVFPLLLIDTHRQSLILPSHHLHYDTYTATARVQVVGSIVYSNYSVRVQVMPSPPIAIIDGGTNIFINNRNTTIVTLDGRRSYDPDFPLNPVSLTWTCKPVSSIISSCFDQLVPASSPVLTFPASFLKHNFDQFRFTLTIHSGERSASSETFLTIKSNLKGKVSVYCPLCRGDQVNWDQSFSISASCEDCDISPKLIQFSWSLFLVNASSKPVIEIPFCYTVDLNAPSAIMDNLATSPPIPETSTLNPPNTDATQYSSPPSSPKMTQNLLKKAFLNLEPVSISSPVDKRAAMSGEEPFHDPPELPYLYSGYSDSSLFSDASGYDDIVSEPSVESDSSAGWEFPVLESGDFESHYDDVPFLTAEEGESGVSAGRPTGVDGETFIPIDGSEFDPLLHRDEGSNLVDSQPPVMIQEPTLLDLPRDSVDRGIFESYTSSGISSALLSFRPFSLKPGSRYMLEVTAKSQNSFLGRTQLFLKTEPVPRGMTCQVQPMNGLELHTHFSIFCTSGREDLLYKYSFSVGDRPPRTLYEGRDFQYYFNLPSGDPSDDYKVTVFTEIRSNTDGGVTKPCPVTVRVRPRFHREASSSHNDPDLELSEFSLKNLSALVGLGNTMETVNYISLLSSILNRLSLDSHEHKHIRNVLICTVCELQHTEQVSVADVACILKELLQVTDQVTLASARCVILYIQSMSEQFADSSAPVRFHLDQKTLNTLVDLLSYSLQTFTSVQICNNTDIKEALEIDGCLADVSRGSHIKQGGFISSKQLVQLVADILHTASNLMLKFILFHKSEELRLDTGLICLYVTYLNQTSTVSSGSANVFIPASLIQRPFVHHVDSQSVRNHEKPCVLILLTELTHSPYTWASPGKLTGPVVELSFYKCSTRRKIPIRSIHQPINIDLQQAPKNMSSVYDSILQRSQINYHSFNITQEHLQQVIQLRVQFKPSFKKMFPIMLLFRMFERPTPSMHHLRRIHNWESNITHITLPSSYLSTSGVGHLAVLNADFAKRRRWKHLSDPVMYRVRVDSSLCVSWDDHQGAWTPHGCRTQQADTPTAAKCSCVQLRPLTVVKQQIQCSRDTTDVNPFISVSSNLTVPIVLVLCVSLYILGLVLIRTTGVESGERRVHYLSDNLPCDPHLYAVTVHTGLCSAAKMSAKVYIVLYGEDGFSQTKELQVPGCTLFRRNSQDTFIISAAENLGSVYRVHIWHDNSGPSPVWYIKQVEVHEVNRGRVEGRPWLFIGQCWLAVNKSDGRVDRMLRVCTQGTGFSKMLYLKLSEYMADFHPWISVCSCPHPHSFTHTHRLTMCLLLLLGYSCVNTVIISQTDEQLPLELGIADLSAVSVTTGILSVIAVLPAATVISLLFRLHKVKLVGSEVKDAGNRKTDNVEDAVSVNSLQQWTQEGLRKTNQDTELTSVSTWQLDKKDDEKPVIQTDVTISNVDSVVADSSKGAAFNSGLTSQWCHCVAWVLCLLLCLSSLVLSTVLGIRFSSSEVLLWIHSVFFSLLSCIFLIHPALIFTVAVSVSFWYRKTPDIHHFFSFTQFETDISKLWVRTRPQEPQGKGSNLNKLLAARQRARYLRLVRPPTSRELRKTLCKKRRESIIQQTLWNLSFYASMLLLMLCITFGSSFSDHYHLNNAIRNQFTRRHDNDFMSIKKYNDWWTWAQNNLLDLLYKNESATTESYILIGEPILLKTDTPNLFHGQVFSPAPAPNCLHLFRHHRSCSGSCSAVGLGHTKTSAASNLKLLLSCGWLTTQTVELKVHFTLYSPAPSLFTSVTLITEQSPTGVLLPTANVHSVRIYHIPAVWDYIVMICQLLFLLLSLLQLSRQVITVGQQGMMGYCRTPCNWLEVSLLTAASVYFKHCLYYSTMVTEAVELLQRRNYKEHVDVSLLAMQQQYIRTLRGIIVFLLILKCVSVLKVNKTLTTSTTLLTPTLSTLLWTTISGLVLLWALFCVGNLLFVQSSWTFSSFPHTLLCPHRHLKTARSLLLSGWGFLYHGALYLFSRVVFTAAVVSVVSSLARRSWRRRKDIFTTSEVVRYIRKQLSAFTDRRRPTHTDNPMDERTYHMEEFESLVDELLCRLNTLSDSLHHTLPSKSHRYREDHPAISSVQESSKMDTQDFMKTHTTEKRSTTTSHLLRSEVEDKMLQVLHQTDHQCEKFLSDISFSSFVHQHEIKTEKTTKDRKLQTSLQGPSLLPGPESASYVRLWKSAQAIHSEVVVEVLVHEERGTVDSDKTNM
ncbi:polycystic kidney disease 1 like 1 [Sphaeramia orbicularis]|uniref:polycystic kidney disease 1 like 1 n=1 Tax=Sphaeramia orbicularis TaxID=375764 RepID=UPI001180EFCE|nr:polycystic kidney disease protein 1-like 1 [Sphaeramia orbicularis]